MKEKKMKNDGTDSKKNDGSAKDVNATDRNCFMQIVNNSGSTVTNVSLTHSSGDTNDVLNMPVMKNNETSFQKQISFETGWWADFDYWNIAFKISSSVYNTPYNDRCNISYKDAGKVISCIITRKDNGDYNLETKMPVSSSCDFVIEKN
jgi:hypothetical protein